MVGILLAVHYKKIYIQINLLSVFVCMRERKRMNERYRYVLNTSAACNNLLLLMFYADRKLSDNIKNIKYSDNTSTQYLFKGNRSI